MKKIVWTFGLIAGCIVVAMMFITMPYHKELDKMNLGMTIGYITMIIALSMIFFAVKMYREKNGGAVSFGKAFLIGLYISLIASFMYVLGWELYQATSNYDYMQEYASSTIQKMRASGAPAADIAREQAQLDSIIKWYKNPILRAAFTITEILPVGIIVSLIVAAILKRKPVNANQ